MVIAISLAVLPQDMDKGNCKQHPATIKEENLVRLFYVRVVRNVHRGLKIAQVLEINYLRKSTLTKMISARMVGGNMP